MAGGGTEEPGDFARWAADLPSSKNASLPMTHITATIRAKKAIDAGQVEPRYCALFETPLVYCFYGRPAYRPRDDDKTVLTAGSCPFCFIFSPDLIQRASQIYPFDTGAYERRLFKEALDDENFVKEDFSLGSASDLPAKIVSFVYGKNTTYLLGDRTGIDEGSVPDWQLVAKAYLAFLASRGRNDVDDRLMTFEAHFDSAISIRDYIMAVVVPHTLCEGDVVVAPWLRSVEEFGCDILHYIYIPDRKMEYYHAAMERVVLGYYQDKGFS